MCELTSEYDKARSALQALRLSIKVKDQENIIKNLSELKDINFNGLDYLRTEYIYLKTKSKIVL